MSVDHLVLLEQGRARHPSAQVAEAHGRAGQQADADALALIGVLGLQSVS